MKPTILAVDDESVNLHLLRQILAEKYRIIPATNTKFALDVLQTHPPDMVLLDIMMPQLDGYSICKMIRSGALKGVPHDIPIIFISALSSMEDEIKGFEVGANDYVYKPIKESVLLARIKTQLELSEVKKQLNKELDETVHGSIQVMTDILSVISPEVYSRANRLRMLVQQTFDYLDIEINPLITTGVLLSQIGAIIVDRSDLQAEDILKGISDVHIVDTAQFDLVGDLIRHIPLLKLSAEIIELQQNEIIEDGYEIEPEHMNDLQLGAQILKVALYYDHLMEVGLLHYESINVMNEHRKMFNEHILKAFIKSFIEEDNYENKHVLFGDLICGMILQEDMISTDDKKLLAKNVEITRSILNMLNKFNVKEPILIKQKKDNQE